MSETKAAPNIFSGIDSELPLDQLSRLMLETILEKSVDVSDPLYKKSFETTYKVNLDICGQTGYQLYEPTQYSFKYGESLEDPDFILKYKDIEFIRERLRGEKALTAMGRDSKNVLQICRREDLFTADTKAEVGNAQLFIARIPFFEDVNKSFGTSAQTLPLYDEPDEPIAPVEVGEIAALMKEMLIESGKVPAELYQKRFQGQPMKVNWEIDGQIAYQNFAEAEYHYEFGKQIEDADITLRFPNAAHAKRFLLNIATNYGSRIVDRKLNVYYKNPVYTVTFKDISSSVVNLGRLPFFRAFESGKINVGPQIEEQKKDEREDFGHYIPIDVQVEAPESVMVPFQVFEHFINKASHIVLRTCPCRERWECKDHSIELGCIFMGDDTKNMALSPEQGYVATKEQALEHTRKAMAEGLMPLMGRSVGEAEDGHGVEDTGKFLSGCFCCSCCCIGVKSRQFGTGMSMSGEGAGSMEGMMIALDEEKCNGCGECVDVCPFDWRTLEEGKSSVDPKRCVGCGKCVRGCPEEAISIDVQDPEFIDNFIAKIESVVDVTDQSLKTK